MSELSQLRRPPRRSRRAVLLAVLIPVGILVTGGLTVGVGLLFHLTAKEAPVTREDREMILDITALSSWLDGYRPDLAKETVVKRRYLDRSMELEYVYSVPSDDKAPYLRFVVDFERKRSDAVIAYHALWGGTKVGLRFGADSVVSVEERNELFGWGDQSRFGILMHKGSPGGNVFVARKGDRVVSMVIAGIYFDDRRAITELLSPVLDKIGGRP